MCSTIQCTFDLKLLLSMSTYRAAPLSSGKNRRDLRFLWFPVVPFSLGVPASSARLGRGVCRMVSNDFSPRFTWLLVPPSSKIRLAYRIEKRRILRRENHVRIY